MKLALAIVLLLAGEAFGCVGEDCWPYSIALTGYEIGPLELQGHLPSCEPLTIHMNFWVEQSAQGQSYNVRSWLDLSHVGLNAVPSSVRWWGVSPEDGATGAAEINWWINRPEGLDSGIGDAILEPATNRLGLSIGDCGYGIRNAPYAFSGKQVMGDSNFDGHFDSGDLVVAFIAGKYELEEVAGWREGDWNIDRQFDSNDFVTAMQFGQYENGSVATVPEPSAALLLIVGAYIAICSVAPMRQ